MTDAPAPAHSIASTGLGPEEGPDVDLTEPARITYAQNLEDVRLWKALGHLSGHLFVDVGAGHPSELSVTKLFTERGWRGINVEPGPNFAVLARERPRDVNVEAAVTAADGWARFFVAHPHPDLSSLHRSALDGHGGDVEAATEVSVRTTRLDTLLADHAPEAPLGFLKVDAEGSELDVLRSNDWARFRPLVVVVEAIEPGSHAPAFAAWEPLLVGAGYRFAVDDGINRFYARDDQRAVAERLAEPVSPVDGFVPWPLLEALARAEAAQAGERRSEAGRQDLARQVAALDAARHELRATLDESLVVALGRDRALKEVTVELRATRDEIGRHVAANIVLIEEARDLKQATAALEASWGMRVGRRVTRRARRFERVLGPPARTALDQARRRRVRPAVVRSTWAELTAAGRPLQTIRTVEPPPAPDVDEAGPLDALWRELARRRAGQPAVLGEAEWDQLVAVADPVVDEAAPSVRALQGLLALRTASSPAGPGAAPRTTLVIDVTGAQIPFECGTRSHARRLLDEVLRAVPEGIVVRSWATRAWPPLEPAWSERFDGAWEPGPAGEVGAFLQLAPFVNDDPGAVATLLGDPGVRSATVWLDAILGRHPDTFLRTAESFFSYQFGLECVARHDRVLSLSRSSAAEVVAAGVAAERVVTTGCRPALASVAEGARAVGLPFARHVLVVGNGLPHKNVAAGVAAFARARVVDGGDLGVVVAADVTAEQGVELVELAARLGLERHRVVVSPQVPAPTFAVLVAAAEATVVPSYHEGFSLPVIESTAAGTPVVVSDIPAHRELLGDGPWWFDPDDPVDLARALVDVLRAPGPALEAQRRALERRVVPERFAATVGQAVHELCQDLVAAPAVVAAAPPPPTAPSPARPPLSLSKICEVEDFTDPRLEPVLAEVFAHEKLRFGAAFPRGREYRKYWEVAMAVLAFGEAGLLDGQRRFLGIGAGNEPTLFHLTRHAAEVLATDLYLAPGWEESANASMLTDPGSHWPFPWRPDRLRVEHRDALDLGLPDASVAGVFSSSSIEHFGDRDAVRRALDECHRVLEPGGVLSLSSEFRLRGDRPGIPGALLFDVEDLEELFLGGRDWVLVEPFDPGVSPATQATASPFAVVAADQQSQVDRLGGLWAHHVTYRRYPHIVLTTPTHDFTSFHLALRKGG